MSDTPCGLPAGAELKENPPGVVPEGLSLDDQVTSVTVAIRVGRGASSGRLGSDLLQVVLWSRHW
jgi:hypothetical protein